MTIDTTAWLDGYLEPAHIAAALEELYPTRIADIAPNPAVPELTEIVFPDASTRETRRMRVIVNSTCEPVGGTEPCTWICLSATHDGPEIVRRLARHFGGYYLADDSSDELEHFSISGHEKMAIEAEKRQARHPSPGRHDNLPEPISAPETDAEQKEP